MKTKIFGIVILLVLFLGNLISLMSVEASVEVRFFANPATKTPCYPPGPIGITYTFDVMLENAYNVTIIYFDLLFNPSKVNITDIVIGDALPGGGMQIGFWDPAAGLIDDITVGVLGTSYDVNNKTVVTVTVETMGFTDSEGTVIDITDTGLWYYNSNIGDPILLPMGDSLYDHTVYILTYSPPLPIYSWLPQIPRVHELVTFNASESESPWEMVSYDWDFGDGHNGSGIIVTHRYHSVGTFNVTLTVTDICGGNSSWWDPMGTKQIYIHPQTHDITVFNVTTSKSGCLPMPTVGKGQLLEINVTVANQGSSWETFNMTVYANMTANSNLTEIATQLGISLQNVSQTILLFTWNTIGLTYGNYTIVAYAWPVFNETYIDDNTLTSNLIKVTIPGDISGDFQVGSYDFALLGVSFGATPWRSGIIGDWNPNSDLNGNKKIDSADFAILSVNYGEKYVY